MLFAYFFFQKSYRIFVPRFGISGSKSIRGIKYNSGSEHKIKICCSVINIAKCLNAQQQNSLPDTTGKYLIMSPVQATTRHLTT